MQIKIEKKNPTKLHYKVQFKAKIYILVEFKIKKSYRKKFLVHLTQLLIIRDNTPHIPKNHSSIKRCIHDSEDAHLSHTPTSYLSNYSSELDELTQSFPCYEMQTKLIWASDYSLPCWAEEKEVLRRLLIIILEKYT